MRGTRHLVAWAALLLVSGRAARADAPPPPVPDAGGKLAVVVVVDGLGAEALERFKPWFDGGFDRLLREGRVARKARFEHFHTETAPGHATIATGVPPREHGIVLNEWWATTPQGSMKAVYSAAQPEGPGAGLLRAPTLADRLREGSPGSRVLSLSGKDRAACLLAGKDPRHAVAWFSAKATAFVTSKAYRVESPEQVALERALAALGPSFGVDGLTRRFGTVWRRLPDKAGARRPPPSPLGSSQDTIVGPRFDHDIAASARPFGEAFQRTPFQDALLADLATTLLADPELALGRRGVSDLLFLSFSGHDYVAHAYGSESEEALEVLRHLDATLRRILDVLDAALPRERLVVALTSDHGFSPLPESRRPPGGRLVPKVLVRALNEALVRELCLAPGAAPIRSHEAWGLYYDRSVLPLTTVAGGCGAAGRSVGPVELGGVIRDLAKRVAPGKVADVIPQGREGAPGTTKEIRGAIRASTFPGRSPDLYLIPVRGVILDDGGGRGANHGSPYAEDARVPLILRGGPNVPGGFDAEVSPASIAPALAGWLGVTIP